MLCALNRDVCEGCVHQLRRVQCSTLAGIVFALKEAQHMALTSVNTAALFSVGPPFQLPPSIGQIKRADTHVDAHEHIETR